MNTIPEKKPGSPLDKKVNATEAATTTAAGIEPLAATLPHKNDAERFREAIKALDAQRSELVKDAIDNIKPGRTFDSSVVRKINKLETMRNRLIVARFAWLLKNSAPNVHAIVHQIIDL